jgi:hypothetical protein
VIRKLSFLFFVSILIAACESVPSVMKPAAESQGSAYTLDLSEVKVVGDGAFIPVNKLWSDSPVTTEDSRFISYLELLNIIDAFKRSRSDLEILDWHVDRGGNTGQYIPGIWVVTRKR